MALEELAGDFKIDAVAIEAARTVAYGFTAGLFVFGLAVIATLNGFHIDSAIWSSAIVAGFVVSFLLYALYFGFSITKVTRRLERHKILPSPDVTFGRMDVLLRRLWMFGWILGLAESAALVFFAP